MVDKRVGSAGTMRITDDGTYVSFTILCSDPATQTGGYPWRVRVNGVWSPASGMNSTPLGAGFGSRLLVRVPVSSSQTVRFEQGNTGTQGLGGSNFVELSVVRGKPGTPTDLQVTRVSDARIDLLWSRQDTYTTVEVARRTDDGPLYQVALVTGNAYQFTDTTTGADHKYTYQVSGRVDSRASEWSAPATVFTTPSAPTGASAERAGSGIVVSATAVPRWASSFDVMDGATVVVSGVTLPWTDAAPDPAVPHTYKVRGVAPGPVAGAWSAPSNTVQLIAPPNAPVSLSPNGGVVASDLPVVLSWTHNPVDSSAQSAFEVQWRPTGGVWTTVSGTTASTTTVTLPAGGFEWQVRTKGADPAFSPWSAVATVQVIDRPGVVVVSPDGSWDSSVLTAGWTWFQAQSRPQSGWEARLLDGSLVVVESRNGSGAATSVTFSTRLTQGDWQVQVRAATGDVWSPWGVSLFTVTFDPPAHPIVDASWDESQGGVNLSVASGDPGVVIPPVTNLFTNPSFEAGSGTVEVRRNFVNDPLFADLPKWGGWASATDGAGRVKLTMPASAANNVLVPPSSWFSSLTSGVVSAGYLVENLSTSAMSFQVRGWNGTTYVTGPTVTVAAGATTLVKAENQAVLAGSTYFQTRLYWTAGGIAGDQIRVSHPLTEKSPVLGAWFEPGSPGDVDMTAAFEGATNASALLLTGVPVTGLGPGPVGTIIQSQQWAQSGVKSLRMVGPARAGGTYVDAYTIPGAVARGKTYTIIVSTRTTGTLQPSSYTNRVTLRTYGAAEALINGPQAQPGPGVQDLRWTVTVPDDPAITSVAVRLYRDTGAPGTAVGDLWWDDLTVVEGTYDGPAFSGATGSVIIGGVERRTQWDGAVDASTSSTVDMPATTSVVVERSIDGDAWEKVIETTAQATAIDWESWSYGDSLYRATAFTAEGATAVTQVTVEARSGALWLSGGVGFGVTCRLPMSPQVTGSTARERVLKKYAGRSKPVAYTGEALSRTWQVSGTVTDRTFIEPTATPDQLLELAQTPEVLFLFRDPDGRRIYGSIGEITLGRQTTARGDDTLRPWTGFWGFGVTITEATKE